MTLMAILLIIIKKKNDYMENITYTIRFNRFKRTYTIREYLGKKLVAKYRSYPQGHEYSENWTENDIKHFLRHTDDYYTVKSYPVI